MAHEIDESNGQQNMAYTGEVPWHGLGSKLPVDASLEDWKKAAGLTWQAKVAPIQFMIGKKQHEYEDRFVLYRDDTDAPLYLVSSAYKPVQPGDILEFFREAVEKFGFKMETAGALRGGRKVWALGKNDSEFKVGKDDVIKRYILAATSYDMTIATIFDQTSIRVVCNNTLSAAIGAKSSARLSFKHLRSLTVDEVKQRMALDDEWKHFKGFVADAAAKKLTDKKVAEYFNDVLFPEAARNLKTFSETAARKRVDEMLGIYHQAPGQEFDSAKGKLWGALNAVTYFVDHSAKADSNDNRMDRAWFGDRAFIKRRALDLASQLV